MKPEKIKDSNKKLSTDPNYNARTLYVPEDFKQGLTPVSIYCFCSLCYMYCALICIIFYLYILGCSTMVGIKISEFWLYIVFQSRKILWDVSYGCCYSCQRTKSFVYEGNSQYISLIYYKLFIYKYNFGKHKC